MCMIRTLRACTITFLVIGLVGCATRSPLAQFYKPNQPGLQQVKVPVQQVRLIDVPWEGKAAARLAQKYLSEGYQYLGTLSFIGPMQDPIDITRFAGAVGGNLVVRNVTFVGMKQGSRMVLGSYTPGTVVTSTHTASANAYATSSGSLYTQGGPSYFNTQGNVSAYGSGSSTTMVSPQATYVRQEFEYPAYEQRFGILQSESAFRKNASNVRRYMKTVKGKTFSDESFAVFLEDFIAEGKLIKLQ